VIRDEEIECLFADTVPVFEATFLDRLRLSEEETATFEERLFHWFDRFTRRPGTGGQVSARLQVALLSGACRLALSLAESKGIAMPSLNADPVEIARRLGLLKPEAGGPIA
jgi:hypothetical protein